MQLISLGHDKTLAVIKDRKFFFSHNSCVAYEDPFQAIRTELKYSITTIKHLKEMGVDNFKIVSDAEFQKAIAL